MHSHPSRSAIFAERHVAPSILSADFSRLGEQVDAVIAAGARVIHVDVMDGHFVPPITFGAVVMGAIAERVHAAGAILDVHLMIERPERHVRDFAEAYATAGPPIAPELIEDLNVAARRYHDDRLRALHPEREH